MASDAAFIRMASELSTRHRALADASRGRVLAELVEAGAPLDAAELARLLDVRVYTIGAVGGAVLEVDEEAMAGLSELTGAQYFRASDERALAAIYDRIQKLEKSRVGRRQPAGFDDVYLLLLLPAAALLVLELVLATTVFRRAP